MSLSGYKFFDNQSIIFSINQSKAAVVYGNLTPSVVESVDVPTMLSHDHLMRFHEYIIYKTGSSHIAVKFQPLLKSQAILAESHFLFESVVLLTVNSQSLVQKSLTVSAGDVDSDSCLSTSSQLDLLPAQNPQVIGDVPMIFL